MKKHIPHTKATLIIAVFISLLNLIQHNITEAMPKISYQAHVENIGWLPFVSNDEIAGTVGQSRRMEAIRIVLADDNQSAISYNAHLANIGWQGWKNSGEVAGTTGQNRQMEAIQIRLTEKFAKKYDIYYRAHVAGFGWLGWVKNGQIAGTIGQSRRMEAVQIKLAVKNEDDRPAPPGI